MILRRLTYESMISCRSIIPCIRSSRSCRNAKWRKLLWEWYIWRRCQRCIVLGRERVVLTICIGLRR